MGIPRKTQRRIWNFLWHYWKKPSVSDDEVRSLNLMPRCCNTHPVANQESFHKSQGQLQQQLARHSQRRFLLFLRDASRFVYCLSRATSMKELLLYLFVRVFPARSTSILCHNVEPWLFMFWNQTGYYNEVFLLHFELNQLSAPLRPSVYPLTLTFHGEAARCSLGRIQNLMDGAGESLPRS